jgi:ABC-type nitrate/sulfonate/bicarbonate transport system substrate-binding protein
VKRNPLIAGLAGMAIITGLAACSSPAEETPQGVETLRVALGAAGTHVTPIILAETLGFADAEGVDLEFSIAGANVLNVVLAGQADVGQGGVGTPLPPIESGKATKIIYSVESGAVSSMILAVPGIETFADCKTVVTSALGSSAYAATMTYIAAVGTTPEVRPVGDNSTIVPALLTGQADCAVNAATNLLKGMDEGLTLIADPHDPETMPDQTPLAAAGVVLFGENASLQSNGSAIAKFLRAIDSAVAFLETASERDVAKALEGFQGLEAFTVGDLEKLYANDRPFLAPNGGFVDEEIWEASRTFFAPSFPPLATDDAIWEYSNVIDMSYLESARSEG